MRQIKPEGIDDNVPSCLNSMTFYMLEILLNHALSPIDECTVGYTGG